MDLDPRWEGSLIPREHWHFHRKLLNRYGIILAPGDFSNMLKSIQNGEARLMKRGGKKKLYSVRIKSVSERIYLFMDGPRIVTVLPPSKVLNRKRRAIQPGSDKSAPEVA